MSNCSSYSTQSICQTNKCIWYNYSKADGATQTCISPYDLINLNELLFSAVQTPIDNTSKTIDIFINTINNRNNTNIMNAKHSKINMNNISNPIVARSVSYLKPERATRTSRGFP